MFPAKNARIHRRNTGIVNPNLFKSMKKAQMLTANKNVHKRICNKKTKRGMAE